jgi:hypothetical protein
MKSTTNRAAWRWGCWMLGAAILALGCVACKRMNEGAHPQTLGFTIGQAVAMAQA